MIVLKPMVLNAPKCFSIRFLAEPFLDPMYKSFQNPCKKTHVHICRNRLEALRGGLGSGFWGLLQSGSRAERLLF